MVKEFLSQRGIQFEERDVSRDRSAAEELVRTTGQMGVPVTIINGQAIIGFDQDGLEQALSRTQRPSFGAAVADASKITARQGTNITYGAYVGKIRQGSSAQRMGLNAGDIIVEINKQRIENAADLENVISRMSGGSRITVVFLRKDAQHAAEGQL